MNVTKKWFTYSQVANRYGVTKMTVYRWVKNGQLDAQKVGGRIFFTKDALKDFESRRA